jgi:hypothetical protein
LLVLHHYVLVPQQVAGCPHPMLGRRPRRFNTMFIPITKKHPGVGIAHAVQHPSLWPRAQRCAVQCVTHTHLESNHTRIAGHSPNLSPLLGTGTASLKKKPTALLIREQVRRTRRHPRRRKLRPRARRARQQQNQQCNPQTRQRPHLLLVPHVNQRPHQRPWLRQQARHRHRRCHQPRHRRCHQPRHRRYRQQLRQSSV